MAASKADQRVWMSVGPMAARKEARKVAWWAGSRVDWWADGLDLTSVRGWALMTVASTEREKAVARVERKVAETAGQWAATRACESVVVMAAQLAGDSGASSAVTRAAPMVGLMVGLWENLWAGTTVVVLAALLVGLMGATLVGYLVRQ